MFAFRSRHPSARAALILCVALAVLLCPAPRAEAGLKRSFPFEPGEKLVYDLWWTAIYAGQATLEVVGLEDHNGTLAYHFKATARSSDFLDTFYEVRDEMHSWTDLTVDRTLNYEQHQREGSYEKDIWLEFDWSHWDDGAGQASVSRFGRQGFKQRIELTGDTLDPLAVLYHFRSHFLSIGRVIQGWVTDGKKLTTGQGEVTARESVSVPAGEFDAFVVVPDTREVGGVFEKSKDAKVWIWFTNDMNRIPVKMKTKVVIGHVTADLISIEGPAAADYQ